MRDRDAWLFASLGWDPTWQRRVPRRVWIAWTLSFLVIGVTMGALALLGALLVPRAYLWAPLTAMLLGLGALSLIQYLVRREVFGRLDVERDQRAAREIQERLLPATLPDIPGADLAGHYSPFKLVGGDYYDILPLGDARLLLVIADVSGKGSSAALLAANLQALLHFSPLRDQGPDAIVRSINQHLVRYTEVSRFVTMVLAVFDARSRRLRYVNAGHVPPVVAAPDGRVVELGTSGPALGLIADATYDSREVDLPAGSTVLFYTDGLSERMNAAGELYDGPRVSRAVARAAGRTARDVVNAVVADVEAFAAGVQAEDDTAVVVLRSISTET